MLEEGLRVRFTDHKAIEDLPDTGIMQEVLERPEAYDWMSTSESGTQPTPTTTQMRMRNPWKVPGRAEGLGMKICVGVGQTRRCECHCA